MSFSFLFFYVTEKKQELSTRQSWKRLLKGLLLLKGRDRFYLRLGFVAAFSHFLLSNSAILSVFSLVLSPIHVRGVLISLITHHPPQMLSFVIIDIGTSVIPSLSPVLTVSTSASLRSLSRNLMSRLKVLECFSKTLEPIIWLIIELYVCVWWVGWNFKHPWSSSISFSSSFTVKKRCEGTVMIALDRCFVRVFPLLVVLL